MRGRSISVRTSLFLIIGLMGLMGISLVLATAEVYRHHAFASRRDAVARLVHTDAEERLGRLRDILRGAGLALLRDPALRPALESAAPAAGVRIFSGRLPAAVAGVRDIKLEKLLVLGPDYTLYAESATGLSLSGQNPIVCHEIIARVRAQSSSGTAEPAPAGLCLWQGRPYYGVLMPVHGGQTGNHLMLVADPVPYLGAMARVLGLPLTVSRPDGATLYQSPGWPAAGAVANAVEVSEVLETPRHEPAVRLAVVSDLAPLRARLGDSRFRLILAAALLLTLLAGLGGLAVLETSTFRPLLTLKDQLRRLRADRRNLGVPVRVEGNTEIRDLAMDFNAMTLELSELYRTLERMAFTDSLTKLANRSRFNIRLDEFIRGCQETGRGFALLLMDLDRFKRVNDTLGHHVGDQLLQQVGQRLEGVLRESDTVIRLDGDTITQLGGRMVARFGGDEFTAILPGVSDVGTASRIVEKILRAMDEPFAVEAHRFKVGLSVGIVFCPEHGTDQNTLLRRADLAMYQAKHNQRSYAFFDGTREDRGVPQLDLEQDLHQAVNNNELELHFQPKVDIRTGQVCGAEALLRWHHPRRGEIAPEVFIPLAEQTGLIQPITRWLLGRALRACAGWQQRRHMIGVAVNLSALNLQDPDMTSWVTDALLKAVVAPQWLTIELTESAVMADPDHALGILTRLDAMGVKIAIDDFGTGYSSLAYLRRLPVDEIKIDKSFVMDMLVNDNDEAIVRAIIGLAHHMKLKVVAEGVKDQDTYRGLAELGCDMVQGYYVSRPVVAGDFPQWLNRPWSP